MTAGFVLAQLLAGLANASSLFLVAAGLSLIFGVTRIVNFAHGSLTMLGAYVAFFAASAAPWGFWPGVLAAALAVALVGGVLEVAVLRRLYRSPELYPLVATFGVVLVVQDAALWLFGPEDRLGPRAPGFTGVIRILGEPVPTYDLALVAIAPAVLGLMLLLLHRTRAGVLLRAAAADREMVGALGVDSRRLYTGAFVAGAFLAGLGGALTVPREPVNLMIDLNIIAEAFVVVVTGGMGSLLGAYVAAVAISVANAFGVLILPQVSLVLPFLVMALVLVVRPDGLFGARDALPPPPPDPPLRSSRAAVATLALAAAGAVLLPLAADPYALTLGVDVLVAMLTAVSLHLVMGLGGMVSFGFAAFFGLGAYGAALGATALALPMLAAMALGAAAGAAGGALFGLVSLRVSGVYRAMLSLAFAQVLWGLTFQWRAAFGGDDGIRGVWPPQWADRTSFYLIALAVCGAGILALRHAAFAPFGFALRATRDSPLRAEAVGIAVGRVRALAFALAGAGGGLAGAVFAFSRGSVFPEALGIARSVDALVMVLVGGMQSLLGPLFGAAAFTLARAELEAFAWWRALLGTLIVVVATAAPHGLAGMLRRPR